MTGVQTCALPIFARALARDVLGDLLAGGRDELVAYVFRPGQTERWRIRRGLPVSVHEALRTLAGNDATGIVLVQPTLLEHGGTLRHAALFQAEIAGLRGGVSVPLEAPLDPVPLPTVRSGPDAWIGVPPTVTFEIAPAAGTVD